MKHLWKCGSLTSAVLFSGAFWAGALAQDLIVSTAPLGAKRLKIANSTAFFSITSGTFTNLTSTTVVVPGGPNRFRILARFSGESNCQGVAGSWCSLRILVDGVEMNPVVGNDFAFDSPGDNWSGKAIERTSDIVFAGTHTVTLQGALSASASRFRRSSSPNNA